MIEVYHVGREVAATLRHHRRPLLTFHVYFAVLALCTLAPAMAWLLGGLLRLAGEPMFGNEDLVRFLLTPAGLLWLLVATTLGAVLVFVQHAGMLLICSRDCAGHYPGAVAALARVGRRLPALLKLAGLQVVAHLLLAALPLALLGLAFAWLLGGYDIYYVINVRPPELWWFLGIASVLGLVVLVLNGGLYLRWLLALPVLLLERRRPRVALARSAALTRGSRLRIAAKALTVAACVAALPLMLSLLFDTGGALLLSLLPERYAVLVPALLLLIGFYAVLGVLAAFVAMASNSLLILTLYHRRRAGAVPPLPEEREGRGTGLKAWSLEALVLLLALGQVAWAVNAFERRDAVAISAHRGSSMLAPENTLAAIHRAIADGADYVELDVRQTADGELVLLHDRDLLRIAGVARNVWEMTFDELRELDAGRWFDPAFTGERVPTLGEAIAALRGRAGLYLEIKPSPHSPDLTREVIRALQREDFVADTVLAALDPGILREARRLAPGLRTSLLLHTAIGRPEREDVDALALRDALVTPAMIQRARRHGLEVHVWTVNDPRAMSRFIDMGVDHIITDRPDVLADLLAQRDALTDLERLLLRLRNWIW